MKNLNPKISWIIFGVFSIIIIGIVLYYSTEMDKEIVNIRETVQINSTAIKTPQTVSLTESPSPSPSKENNPACGDPYYTLTYHHIISDGDNFIYVDDDAHFSFKYPANIIFNNKSDLEQTGLVLTARVPEIKCMIGPMGFDNENALKDKAELEKGEIGERFDWPDGTKVIKIDGGYAKTYAVFGRFESSSIEFEKFILLYNDDYQIVIGLSILGDDIKKDIIKDYSEYFYKYSTDKNLPLDGYSWKEEDDIHDRFYNELSKTKNASLKQLNSVFEEIIKSIKIIKE